MKFNPLFAVVTLLLVSTASYATETTLVCAPRCETAQGNGAPCDPTSLYELHLGESVARSGNLTWGGWDGDQLEQRTVNAQDVANLRNGSVAAVFGIEKAGFNYGENYISTWSIECR